MSLHGPFKTTRNVISLLMTEQCNLECSYCYENKTDKTILSVDLAKNAIAKAFEKQQYNELEIDFFGGEPFLAFKNIKKICEWLWTSTWPKPYVCFATTNGTLIHGKIKEWIAAHKERFILCLSLDGTPEMHNANRSNSYSKIDFDFFREMWPFQPIKMTISRKTLPSMADGIIHIHRLGFKIDCNNAFGIEWKTSDYETFAGEMKKLADFYVDHPKIEPCSIMTMPI